VVLCAGGLAYGQYALTGDVSYVVLGAAVAVLDLFRYVNAPQMKRVRDAVREERGEPEPTGEDTVPLEPLPADPAPRTSGPRMPSFFRRLNRFLARHRVRSHLVSGIEFHAAVFVIAPLAGAWALIPLAVAAGLLLLANEIFLVYRMWLFTRRHGVSSQESREHVLV
jgi:hypothetical protein